MLQIREEVFYRQQMELVLRVTFPRGAMGATSGITISLTDRDSVMQVNPERIEWEYSDHPANDAQVRDTSVDLSVAQRYAAQAREEAAELNRIDELEKARSVLMATARRIREYAGRDPEMRRLVHELEALARRHRERFDEHSLKRERFESYSIREAKDLLGRKMRMP